MSPNLILPPRLQPGSRVALIAPSGPLLEVDHVARGVELCGALGFDPVVMPNVSAVDGYFAGTDEQRIADLNAALNDRTIDGVWCLRGGNGMNRILGRVDYAAFASQPKVIIGYSDITLLLLALHARTGAVTFHGPMARFPMTSFVRAHLDAVLTRTVPAGVLQHVAPPDDTLVPARGRIITMVPGVACGRLIGGNLTLLQALIGTAYFPDLNGAILFLEDINEAVHRIDRMLGHLEMAGKLDHLAGVAIGRFSRMRRSNDDGAGSLTAVLQHYFAPRKIPVAYGFPIGHLHEQWTLPIGVRAELDASAHRLTLLEAAVQ